MNERLLSKLKSILKILFNFFYYNFLIYPHQLILEYFIDPVKEQKRKFRKRLHRELVLDNPVLFNDKIQWLKFNWYSDLACKCADKYAVREYVSDKIGAKYLNQLIGVFENANQIDINVLPNSFVIKASHGGGFNIFCTNKDLHNWKLEKIKLNQWLKTKFYLFGREWVYECNKPVLIVEKFLVQNESLAINDYKFFCFHGIPRFFYISYKIYDSLGRVAKTRKYFTMTWEEILANSSGELSFVKQTSEKPRFIKEMEDLCLILAEPFPHVRVDFFYENNQIYFGELTFFNSKGMELFASEAFELWVSSFLDLKLVN